MSFIINVKNTCVSDREITVKHYKPDVPDPSQQDVPRGGVGLNLDLTSADDYLEIQIKNDRLYIKSQHIIILPDVAFINFLRHPTDSDIFLNVTEASGGRKVFTIPAAGANEQHTWKLFVKMPPSSFNKDEAIENDNVTVSDDGGL